MTQNQIDYAKLLESRRSNQAQEAQTALRDQRAYEVNFFNAQEMQRANLAKEAQNQRSQLEIERSNRAKEEHARNQLAEDARYHSMTVGLGYAQLAETKRSNKERETETWRHNTMDESIRRDAEKTKAKEARIKQQDADTREKEADIKDRQLGLDFLKHDHQKQMDILNYRLDAKRVDLQAEHQHTVDPAYVNAQDLRAERDRVATYNDAYALGSSIVGDLASAGLVNLFKSSK